MAKGTATRRVRVSACGERGAWYARTTVLVVETTLVVVRVCVTDFSGRVRVPSTPFSGSTQGLRAKGAWMDTTARHVTRPVPPRQEVPWVGCAAVLSGSPERAAASLVQRVLVEQFAVGMVCAAEVDHVCAISISTGARAARFAPQTNAAKWIN